MIALAVSGSSDSIAFWTTTWRSGPVVADHTGIFYGVPITAGDIYNIAGGGMGTRGDGGPARDARFEAMDGIVTDGSSGLVIIRTCTDPNDRDRDRDVLRRADDCR